MKNTVLDILDTDKTSSNKNPRKEVLVNTRVLVEPIGYRSDKY